MNVFTKAVTAAPAINAIGYVQCTLYTQGMLSLGTSSKWNELN